MSTEKKIISMVQYILEIDWLTTKEFCDKYMVPHPYFIGNVKTSADMLLQIDAIKHNMFVTYAKILNKNITSEILVKNLGFENVQFSRGLPKFKNGKYEIINDQYGYTLLPYDSMDGCRIHEIVDLVDYDMTYKE